MEIRIIDKECSALTEGKISVIVPVYNAEQFLDKCIQSIRRQTYSNLEIILVEDGSTDSSLSICRRHEKEDGRIRVVAKENQGVSAARNTGLDCADGEYIGFVDSDDYIEEDMYETLLSNLKEGRADLAICGIAQVYDNRVIKDKVNFKKVVDREEAVFMVLESRYISVNPVNRLFKRELFDGLRFPVGMTSEDAYLILDILAKTERVSVDLTPKYYYVHRTNSITTSGYKKTDWCVITAYQKNKKIVEERYPRYNKVAEFRLFWAYYYVLDKMLLSEGEIPEEEKREVVSFLKKNWFRIIKNPYVGRGRKIATVSLRLGVPFYKIFLNQYRRGRKRI